MTESSTAPAPRWLFPLAALLVLVLGLALYGPGLEGSFVYDDLRLVERAPASRSVSAAVERFFEPLYAFENPGAEVQRGLWRPLTSMAFGLGRGLGDGDPFAYHVLSLGLHLASALLLMGLVGLLVRTRTGVGATRAGLAAGIAGLLFVAHPAQVESVAWISAINDPLWVSLGLGALLLHERAGLRGRSSWAAPALVLAALLAKEHAVVLPALALLLDLTAGRRPRAGAALGMLMAVAAWYGLRVVAFGDGDGGLLRKAGDYGLDAGRAWSLRLELFGGFVRNTVLPTEPAVFRPLHPVLPEGSNVLAAAALWTAGFAAAALLALVRRRRAVAAGLLGMAVVVAPMVLLPTTAGRFPLSDRYLYLAVGCGALALVALLARLRSALPLVGIGLAATAGCAWVARGHVGTFAGDVAFNVAAVEDAPDDPNVRWGASNAYFRSYARTRDVDDLMRAYIHCLHSLRAGQVYGDGRPVDDPSEPLNVRMAKLERMVNDTPPEERRPDPTVFVTLDDRFQATLSQVGCLALLTEVTEDADPAYVLEVIEQAKRVWGEAAGLNFWAAWIHQRTGDLEAAREAAGKAVAADPTQVDARGLLADVLARLGDSNGAALLARENLDYAKDDVPRLVQHAGLAIDARRFDEARASIDRAVELSGGRNGAALVARASLELALGRPRSAIEWADRALAVDRDNGYAHRARGQAYALMNDVPEATSSFGEAARLIPDDFLSHYQLASLLLSSQPPPDADEAVVSTWRNTVVPVLVQAYYLSPRRGTEQLAIQGALEGLVGDDADDAFMLGMGLVKQGRHDLALYWLRRATELGQDWPEAERRKKLSFAHAELGLAYARLGRPEEAEEQFTRAAALTPDDFGIQFELGNVRFGMGKLEEALEPLERALALFEGASVRPEMRDSIRSGIVQRLRQIESARRAGPPLPPPAPAPGDGSSSAPQK